MRDVNNSNCARALLWGPCIWREPMCEKVGGMRGWPGNARHTDLADHVWLLVTCSCVGYPRAIYPALYVVTCMYLCESTCACRVSSQPPTRVSEKSDSTLSHPPPAKKNSQQRSAHMEGRFNSERRNIPRAETVLFARHIIRQGKRKIENGICSGTFGKTPKYA